MNLNKIDPSRLAHMQAATHVLRGARQASAEALSQQNRYLRELREALQHARRPITTLNMKRADAETQHAARETAIRTSESAVTAAEAALPAMTAAASSAEQRIRAADALLTACERHASAKE